MKPYQKEYIANIKDIAGLTVRKAPAGLSFDAYFEKIQKDHQKTELIIKRNMALLREELFPVLDHMPEACEEDLNELREFASNLLNGPSALDAGLFCQIHKALLSLSRQKKDQKGMIRELYWLGIGRYHLCNKLIGLDYYQSEHYISQMRLCFTEAAAYLKYFDIIDDLETRSYILRSRANMALGEFKSSSMKIHLIKQTLQIMQDKEYQKTAPSLPWDRFIFQTHQLMASSISYEKENSMTSQDIADIMDSVYLVHQRQIQAQAGKKENLSVRTLFPYYSITYYCGLESLDGLLTKLESLMDAASPLDYSTEGMYGVISLPAFYCQYLQQYPDRLPDREKYLEGLYLKILSYVDTFPDDSQNESLFHYLRQLSFTFVETKNSISYGDFLQNLQMRFAPEIYIHSYAVGKAAAAFCHIIIKEEPSFFDDIEFIREIADHDKKRQAILDYAMACGVFHDVGKLSFINLYTQTTRQWFEEEYEMEHLHTLTGETCLATHASTCRYSDIAKGHHRWYDSSRGYPDSYLRLNCQARQMVDVIGLIDYLDCLTKADYLFTGLKQTFEEAVAAAVSLEGKRFSPLLTAWLRDKKVTEQIRKAFEEGQLEACKRLYASAS